MNLLEIYRDCLTILEFFLILIIIKSKKLKGLQTSFELQLIYWKRAASHTAD